MISIDYIKYEKVNTFEFSILILLSIIGMLLLVSSYDLLSLYLALEMQSLCLYVLAAYKRNSEFSLEAGLKYLILSAFSSGILLLGISFIYGFTGLLGFEDLNLFFINMYSNTNMDTLFYSNYYTIQLGVLFIIISLLFKINAAPFHMWAPDVYEGAPTVITAFFSVVPKLTTLGLLIQLLISPFHIYFYSSINYFFKHNIFFYCSIFSILIGSLAALYQKRIKRLLAYSTISHIGFILMGFLCGINLEKKFVFFSNGFIFSGLEASFLYIFIYIVMSINFFTIILSLRRKKDLFLIKYLTDFSNLNKINPLLAITFVLGLLSMAGIPPLAGFISKFYLFLAALRGEYYFLAILGILLSSLSAFYYIRLIKIMYFEKESRWDLFIPIDREKSIILSLTFFCILFFLINPEPFLYLINEIIYFLKNNNILLSSTNLSFFFF